MGRRVHSEPGEYLREGLGDCLRLAKSRIFGHQHSSTCDMIFACPFPDVFDMLEESRLFKDLC